MPTATWSRSTSASWAGSDRRSGDSSPRSCSVSSPATTVAPPRCISRPATCRPHIRSRASRRRSAPSASRSTTAPPRRSRWRACSCCCSRSPPCSTCAPGRNCCCCRRPWWWWRAWGARSTRKLDMWAVAEPVVREWITRNLGPAGRIEHAAQGALEVGRFLGEVPGLLARGATLLGQLDAITRDGLVLAPETVAQIGRAEARRNRGHGRGALDHRGAAGLRRLLAWWFIDRCNRRQVSIALIAIASHKRSARKMILGRTHGQHHHSSARRGGEDAAAASRGAQRPLDGGRGPHHPACAPAKRPQVHPPIAGAGRRRRGDRQTRHEPADNGCFSSSAAASPRTNRSISSDG